MNDHFNEGIEHIISRIVRYKDEINEQTNKKNELEVRISELRTEISKIDNFTDNLTTTYELLYNISKFHDRNNFLLQITFNSGLRKLNTKYSNKKQDILNKSDVFLNERDVINDYFKNKNILIKDLMNTLSGNLVEIDTLLSSINNFNLISRNFFLKITQGNKLIRILTCYIYIELILWNPFHKNQFMLGDFIKNYNSMSDNKNINAKDDNNAHPFNWISFLLNSNDNFNDIRDMINNTYVNEYILEIINNYWSPINVSETESLFDSIIYLKSNLNLKMDKFKQIMIEKYNLSLGSILLNYNERNIYNEYQLVYYLLNLSVSLNILIRKMEIGSNSTNELIKKVKSIIIKFIQDNSEDVNSKDLINLLKNIQINLCKLTSLLCNNNIKNNDMLSSIMIDEEIIKCEREKFNKLNPINMNYIYNAVCSYITSYNINYDSSYYSLCDIILNLLLNK